jgi:pilus assembly protein CpaE
MAQNANKSTINTLLPPGEIHVFSTSAHNVDATHALKKDWRFARLDIEMKGGNIDDAIGFYKDHDSPHLVIIQVDSKANNLEERLASLSEYCDEGTAAIIIGSINDVQLYRNLMAMGVSDYLVEPFSQEDFVSAIGSILLNMMGTLGSQLIAVTGAKGGVGTSSLTSILAYALSDTLNQKTLLLDAAAGHSSLWSLFGFKPTGTIIEAAKAAVDRDPDELKRLLVQPNEMLSVLNCGAERLLDNPAALQAYEMLLDRILRLFPYVMIDLSGAPELIQRNVLARANSIFAVTTPTVTSLSMCRAMLREIRDLRGGENAPITLINNQKGRSPALEVSPKDLPEAVDVNEDHIVHINDDPKLFIGYESDGKTLKDGKEGQALIHQFAPILANTINIKVPANFDKSGGGAFDALLNILKK